MGSLTLGSEWRCGVVQAPTGVACSRSRRNAHSRSITRHPMSSCTHKKQALCHAGLPALLIRDTHFFRTHHGMGMPKLVDDDFTPKAGGEGACMIYRRRS